MMADLGLAIDRLTSDAVSLESTISAFCKSPYKVPREIHELESHLKPLQLVVHQVENAFRNPENVCSERAERDLRSIIEHCHQIFSDIETLLAPCQKPDGTFEVAQGARLKCNVKREDARKLCERMEKIQSTLHCMVSIITLGYNLSERDDNRKADEIVSPAVSQNLRTASGLVFKVLATVVATQNQPGAGRANTDYRFNSGRTSSWLSELVGTHDEESSNHSTIQSSKTVLTLSPAEKSIAGDATPEVENLLERWTALSESRSRASQSTRKGPQKPAKISVIEDFKQDHTSSTRPVEHASGSSEKSGDRPLNPSSSRQTPPEGNKGAGVDSSELHVNGLQQDTTESIASSRHTLETSSSVTVSARPRPQSMLKNGSETHNIVSRRRELPPPILRSPYEDDDNATIRALGRIARGPRVKILSRVTEIRDDKDSTSRLDNWLRQNEIAEPVQEDTTRELDALSLLSQGSNVEFDTRSLFSQASILKKATSDTASIMSGTTRTVDPSDPRRVAKLFHAGNKRFRLKKWSEAAEFYRQAYLAKRDEGNEDDQESLRIKFKIGAVFGELNKYESAERTLEGVLSKQKEIVGEEHTETQLTQHYLGRVLSRQSKWEEAYAVYAPLWDVRMHLFDEDSTADLAIRTGNELGRILNEMGRFSEAADVLGVVYPAAKRALGEENKVTLSAAVELAKALRCSERHQDATVLLDEVYELFQRSNNDLDPMSMKCTHELAMIRCHESKFEDAKRLSRSAWISRTAAKGSTDVGTLESAECLAQALYGLGRVEEATDLLEEVYHQLVARLGREHTRSLVVGKDLGNLLLERLSNVRERMPLPAETIPPETLPATTPSVTENQPTAEEHHEGRHLQRQRRHNSEGTAEGIEWYITQRYPLLKKILQSGPLSESPRRERSQDHNDEASSELRIFEDASRDDLVLQALAKPLLVVPAVFKAFEAKLSVDRESMPDAFHFATELGPQLLRLIQELEKPSPVTTQNSDIVDGIKLGLAHNEKRHASSIYQLIYNGQKDELGAESERTLETGHEYACLCLQVNSFERAEAVLREVWVRRQRVLGPANPQTLESGFQLGQIYFKTNRHDTALSLHESVYTVRRDIFGPRSLQTIQSAEIYGQILMCRQSTNIQIQQGWILLHQTLEIRKDMFGVTIDTVISALRLATISAISGKFAQSGELFSWLFEFGVDSLRRPGQFGHSPAKLAVGFAAAGMAFLEKNGRKGNQLLERIGDFSASIYGSRSRETQLVAYLQAFVLLLQGRGRKSRAILQQVFEMRKHSLGRRHPGTKAAGIMLAMGIFLHSLLSKGKIDQELDEINDWLLDYGTNQQDSTFLMQFCGSGAVIATMYDLEDLSKAMLNWLYKTQKRRKGLFNRSTLGTLVLNHGLNLYTMYRRKSQKIPTKEGTSLDPRIFIRELWPAAIEMVTNILAGANQLPFFAETLPNFLQNSTMWKSFAPTQFTAHFFCIFAPVYEQLAPVDAGSRIWTIATDDSDTSTIGEARHLFPSGSSSIDFGDLDGRASEHLSSLGHSLLDLTLAPSSASDLSDLSAEHEMESLQNELVGEFVTDAGISAAQSDIETLKRELET
ncbi:uncharacterized protein PAC_18281 [Phialocephala subalpina]|uniref:Uncharacterized protein n=1 Tax=Phialocephala subalpina TaxID=576137 RepID=A0A1L7XTM3_9HELO|nr:uncharacterized protein PAC_18281 [Phialocephala subalpina]